MRNRLKDRLREGRKVKMIRECLIRWLPLLGGCRVILGLHGVEFLKQIYINSSFFHSLRVSPFAVLSP